MTDAALIFPGQGSQAVGMGRELYDSCAQSREIFDLADRILANGLRDVIFNGPQEKLTSTAFCQPAIVTVSVAALRALENSAKFPNIRPRFTAGHSLGEYSALVASGALSFEETIKLVRERASCMNEATKMALGKMAAIMGLDVEKITEICRSTGAEVANFNSLQQIVITGEAGKVEGAAHLCQEAGAKNVVMLQVSGGFHSSLMKPAAEKFHAVLEKTAFSPANIPLIANVDAKPASDPKTIRANLAKQITSSVQWVDSVLFMAQEGITDFIEIGPGKVLKGLARRIDPNIKVHNIEKPADIEALSL